MVRPRATCWRTRSGRAARPWMRACVGWTPRPSANWMSRAQRTLAKEAHHERKQSIGGNRGLVRQAGPWRSGREQESGGRANADGGGGHAERVVAALLPLGATGLGGSGAGLRTAAQGQGGQRAAQD